MNNFIKENWFKIILIVIIFIIILGSFYWYELRPTKIRENCLAEAEFNPAIQVYIDDHSRTEFINDYYNTCIKRFGLEK